MCLKPEVSCGVFVKFEIQCWDELYGECVCISVIACVERGWCFVHVGAEFMDGLKELLL